MTDLRNAIRERLKLHDTGEHTVSDMRCAYDCELTQAALLAVLELHRPEDNEYVDADGQSRASADCAACDTGGVSDGWPCETVRAVAERLGVEVSA